MFLYFRRNVLFKLPKKFLDDLSILLTSLGLDFKDFSYQLKVIESESERDANRMRRSLPELLGVSDLVGWYTNICLAFVLHTFFNINYGGYP